MTGTQRIMELTNMAAETRDLVARWRGRGVDYDTIARRLAQASLDVASMKHAEAKAKRGGNGART